MKIISILIATIFACTSAATAQTTAPNWTASDCNSASHTLHSELDNGKIIVFVWVMPCGSCINGAKAAYDAVQGFATSDPGKVLYYLADDYGDASCATLNSWVTTNSIGDPSKMTFFGNAGNTINMSDFGGAGMPKVVVMGGTNHKIYFNKNNSAANDVAGISSAITAAIAATGISTLENQINFSVSPNPAGDHLQINHSKAVNKIVILNGNGQVIEEASYNRGTINPVLRTSHLASGVYFLQVTDVNNESGVQKIVKL